MAKKKTAKELAKEKAQVEAFFKKSNPFPNRGDRRLARLMRNVK